MQISIIAALTNNNVIGNNNKLPWHMPADLKHFKAITLGKPIIMGRKTYEAIGKALPGRRNIVITRDKNWRCSDCEIYHSLQEAFAAVKECAEVMVIGGAEIYKTALPLADKMYLTFIHHDFIGDTYFPDWNPDEWQEIEHADYPADEKNPYPYSFVVLQRLSPSFIV
jgi:dihydrofolate reductase